MHLEVRCVSHDFREALAALPPLQFEVFHGALEAYLGHAAIFWRQARGLAVALSTSRSGPAVPPLTPSRAGVLRARLRTLLRSWEQVEASWQEFQAAAEVVLPEVKDVARGALQARVEQVREDHREQAMGLQVLVDLGDLLEGQGDATGPLGLAEA